MAAAHIAEARTLAGPLNDPELTGWIDVTIARNALVGGEVGHAGQLASQALAAAEEAGLTGWAAEVAVESLIVIAHQHCVSDLSSARAAFERAHTIADGQDLGAARIRTLRGLATIDMLAGGGARALADVRRLADDAGCRPSPRSLICSSPTS